MKKLTPAQFKEYISNPLVNDSKVRSYCDIPEDKYFTVSIWPEEGIVNETRGLHRVVKTPKISKSNQSKTTTI
jgi:hypothetical protein